MAAMAAIAMAMAGSSFFNQNQHFCRRSYLQEFVVSLASSQESIVSRQNNQDHQLESLNAKMMNIEATLSKGPWSEAYTDLKKQLAEVQSDITAMKSSMGVLADQITNQVSDQILDRMKTMLDEIMKRVPGSAESQGGNTLVPYTPSSSH